MPEDFTGKNILVTGANRGIGFGVAEGFLKAGAELTITALEKDIFEVANSLSNKYKCNVLGIMCDISQKDQVRSLEKKVDRVDVLINNAGIEYITPIIDKGEHIDKIFKRIIDVNITGTFTITRHLLHKIPDGGRIVNTASIWGKTAVAEFSAYCASKHAIIGLTRSLAQELAPRKISVNSVCPGWVRTIGSMRSLSSMADRRKCSENELLDEIMGAQALEGLMEPKDIVAIYLFLSGQAANNITGQSFTVDRGELMQ